MKLFKSGTFIVYEEKKKYSWKTRGLIFYDKTEMFLQMKEPSPGLIFIIRHAIEAAMALCETYEIIIISTELPDKVKFD